MNIRTLLVGFDDNMRDRLTYYFSESEIEIKGEIRDLAHGTEAIDRYKPGLLLVTASEERKLLMFCQQVYILYPEVTMVVVSDTAEPELLELAMEAGIRRVIAPMPQKEELVSTLKELCIN